MTMRRRFLTTVRDILIFLLITAVLLEFGLRIFHHFSPLPIFYDSSYNRFRVRPHLPIYGFQTNSKGFHDIERTKEKPVGTYRALGIGDSFSFGVVPHQFNWLTMLEKNIKIVRPRFELINMGIPGLSPREYLALLLNEGLELRPNMVLLSFFIGNDFVETAKIDRIYRLSYAANIMKYFYALGTQVGTVNWGSQSEYNDEGPSITDDAFLQIEAPISQLFQKDNAIFQNLLSNSVNHLRAIKQVCDAYDIRLVIIIAPDEMQVNDSLRDKAASIRGIRPEQVDSDQPNRSLSAELTRLGIDHLDLLPGFKAKAPSGRLYKPNDTHWNIRGNALAQSLVYDHILPRIPAGPDQQ